MTSYNIPEKFISGRSGLNTFIKHYITDFYNDPIVENRVKK